MVEIPVPYLREKASHSFPIGRAIFPFVDAEDVQVLAAIREAAEFIHCMPLFCEPSRLPLCLIAHALHLQEFPIITTSFENSLLASENKVDKKEEGREREEGGRERGK